MLPFEVDHDIDDTPDFRGLFARLRDALLMEPPTHVGSWQSQSTDVPVRELLNVVFEMSLPQTANELATITGAHLPWAEDHFQERVGGKPLNPAPSEAWWPFARKTNDGTNRDHKSEGEAFSHTYPERMWPKFANRKDHEMWNRGIRFRLGDLNDVVTLLSEQPYTRQAYLPIWFPEDTGGAEGRRVPCTLGYHFLFREGTLSTTYFMRSTDLLRHFQDDIYMAGRLNQWMALELARNGVEVHTGTLIFHTANLHIFEPDVDMLKWMMTQGRTW